MRSRRRGARPAESALHEGREAFERLRTYLILAVQAGVAAGLAWFVASDVLHNPQPLFAPAAAVGTIAAAIGNRARRTLELLAGVFLGVLVGNGIIRFIGAGPIQTGVVVALAISAAAVFRGTGAVMVQAGSTAVLLGTVSPERPDLAVPRTANALVGVAVAIVVALLILPLNPVRIVHRAAGPTVNAIAREMTATANALAHRDVRQAEDALQRLRAAEAERRNMADVVAAACEVAILSPWRRRRLGIMRRYSRAAEHLELAYTSSREMAQWAVSALRARGDAAGRPLHGDRALRPGVQASAPGLPGRTGAGPCAGTSATGDHRHQRGLCRGCRVLRGGRRLATARCRQPGAPDLRAFSGGGESAGGFERRRVRAQGSGPSVPAVRLRLSRISASTVSVVRSRWLRPSDKRASGAM